MTIVINKFDSRLGVLHLSYLEGIQKIQNTSARMTERKGGGNYTIKIDKLLSIFGLLNI